MDVGSGFSAKARQYGFAHLLFAHNSTSEQQLEIRGSITIPEVESLLSQINSGSSKLLLARHIKDWRIGAEAALMQFFFTWARRTALPIIVTHIRPNEDPSTQLDSLISRPFGFAALLMAADVVTRNEKQSVRAEAYQSAKKRVDRMFRSLADAGRGTNVFLACVDHSTKSNVPHFYYSDGKVRGQREFVVLVNEMIGRSKGRISFALNKAQLAQLGLVTSELFHNTHDWARTDELDVPLKKSLRGLLFETHTVSQLELNRLVEKAPALRSFFSHVLEEQVTTKSSFLEMSVFDSGIGLAKRWLGSQWKKNLSPSAELNACKDCLRKGKSTSSQTTRGFGLFDVFKTLSELGAFLRIRSGRLNLYRDFRHLPYSISDEDNPTLNDWSTASEQITAGTGVEGTLYTFLVPLQPTLR
jgi:hypothetical protein